MFSKFYFLVLLALAWIVFASCDDALTPKDFDEQQPYVQNLVVNPSTISFNPETDGQKDTTLILDVTVDGFNFEADSVPYYSLFLGDDENPFLQDKFLVNFSPITTFQASIPIETNTIDFETYTLLITPSLKGNNENFAQSIIRQTGVPINAPQILEVNNPDTLFRPESGSITAFFTSKIIDLDGQNNLEKVSIRIIDREVGEVQGSPFEMFDDGISNEDQVANDSVFTFSLPVTPTNNRPNRDFDIEYFAEDISGLTTDTLKTIFIIRER